MKAICLILFSTALFAQTPPPEPDFSMMGGALGEIIRLNAVASSDVPPGPCAVALGFTDSSGAAVGRTLTVNLSAGQSAFTEFDFSTVVTRLGQRFEVQPRAVPLYSGSTQGCRLSAEIYDRSSGRTSSYQPPPDPDSTPDFGMVGTVQGQVIRLNLLDVPPGPCRATLGFVNSTGFPIGGTLSASPDPNHAVFLDLPIGSSSGRVEIRPLVQVDSTATSCLASVEVYDPSSGRNGNFVRQQ